MRRANRDPDQEGAAATYRNSINFLLIEVNITITLNTMSTPLFILFGEPAYELKMVRMNFSLNFHESRMTIRMNQRQNRIEFARDVHTSIHGSVHSKFMPKISS